MSENTPNKYPNRLRELREKRQLTQADVATILGVKQPTINRHEQGNRSLDGFAIEKYARFYNVSPYELFVPADYSVDYTEIEYDSQPGEMPAETESVVFGRTYAVDPITRTFIRKG